MVKFIHPKRGAKKNPANRSPLLGKQFIGTVMDIGGQGSGILTHESGQKVFVPGVWSGETVKVKITSVKSQVAIGQLLEVIEPHPQRIAPPCEYHGLQSEHCGGCPWMFMQYEQQLLAKDARVQRGLQKLASAHTQFQPIAAAPSDLQYRTRAQVKTDGEILGFVQNNSHQIVDVKLCKVLAEPVQKQLSLLRAQLPNNAWQPTKKQTFTVIDINQHETSVNKRLPFTQAHGAQNQFMRSWLQQQLEPLAKNKTVLELFAGSGNFTQVIAQLNFAACIALEAVAEATKALAELHLANTEVITYDLFREDAIETLAPQIKTAKILVLDPPRDGYKNLPELVRRLKVLEHIFYISCDLATFTRDTQALIDLGFELQQVQPVDLFPQTPHVEVLAHCTRKGKTQ